MIPLKYFSPKYWARKFFAGKPTGGAAPSQHAGGEFVHAELRGVVVLFETRGERPEEVRTEALLRAFRHFNVDPEDRGLQVPPEDRGVVA